MNYSTQLSDITFSRKKVGAPFMAMLPIEGRFAAINVLMDEGDDGPFARVILISTYIPSVGRGCGQGFDHPDCTCGALQGALKADPMEATSSPEAIVGWGCPHFQMVMTPEHPEVYLIDCCGSGELPRRRLQDVPAVLDTTFKAILSDGGESLGASIVKILSKVYFNPDVRILFSTNGELDASLRMPVVDRAHPGMGATSGMVMH